MMNNDERREVAARLRECGGKYIILADRTAKRELLTAAGFNRDVDWQTIYDRLADLIEPEPERTGHLEFEHNPGDIIPRCSECKKKIGKASRYCQWCGARMVE